MAGRDLHGAIFVRAPGADRNPSHAVTSGREEGGMPREKAFTREGQGVVARGIEHHLDHALHLPTGAWEAGDVEPEPSGDRGADFVGCEFLSLDGRRLDHIFRQHRETGFGAELETQGLQV